MDHYDLTHDGENWKLLKQGGERASKVFAGMTKEDGVRATSDFMHDHSPPAPCTSTNWMALMRRSAPTGVVVLAGVYFGLAVFFSSGRALCEYISRRSSDEKEMNPALIRYLLCDLATYHVWPGPTLTVQQPTRATEKIPTPDAEAQAAKLVLPAAPESALPA